MVLKPPSKLFHSAAAVGDILQLIRNKFVEACIAQQHDLRPTCQTPLLDQVVGQAATARHAYIEKHRLAFADVAL